MNPYAAYWDTEKFKIGLYINKQTNKWKAA